MKGIITTIVILFLCVLTLWAQEERNLGKWLQDLENENKQLKARIDILEKENKNLQTLVLMLGEQTKKLDEILRILRDPTTIPDLKLWLKADKIQGVKDGQSIKEWKDCSGNENHVIQDEALRQPVYKVNMLNGRPAVRFDGVNDKLLQQIPSDDVLYNAFTVFIVQRLKINLTGNGYYPFTIGVSQQINPIVHLGIETRNFASGNDENRLDIFGGYNNDAIATLPGIAKYGEWKLICFQVSETIHNTHVWEKDIPASMSSTGNAYPLQIRLAFALGTSNAVPIQNDTYCTACDIAEVLVYTRVLAEEERVTVEKYLKQKYGW